MALLVKERRGACLVATRKEDNMVGEDTETQIDWRERLGEDRIMLNLVGEGQRDVYFLVA